MYMTLLDWTIVAVIVLGLTIFSIKTIKYMKGVADFLAAGRAGGRYMLADSATACTTARFPVRQIWCYLSTVLRSLFTVASGIAMIVLCFIGHLPVRSSGGKS